MSSKEQSVREEKVAQPQAERVDERNALGPVSDGEGQEDEYTGPDPERADDPPVPEEDQGV